MEQLRSANWSQASCIALAAYLLGCFTPGYYLVRLRLGQDLRDLGSGSVGARNVGRLLGWRGFLLTVLGDFGKGAPSGPRGISRRMTGWCWWPW